MGAIRTAAGQKISAVAEMKAFLAANGIEFAHWGVERVPAGLSKKTLTPEEKEKVLALYKPELDELIARKGYLTADMISLSPDTPNLEGILDVFRKEHFHTDDEVRFISAGQGVFYIRGKDGNIFDCELHAGELIVVPANTWHYFDLCADKQIVAIRVFKTKEGWVANYKDSAPVPASSVR